MKRGKFIVIEGPNGAGKSTLMKGIREELKKTSIPFISTKEPTQSELGAHIRKNQDRYSKYVLACLVAANRYEHIDTIIQPALLEGQIVLSDRYFPSSLVYQLMDGLDADFVYGLNQKILVPDLTVFLTANENLLKSRLNNRSDITRFERDQQLEIKFYKEAFLSLMAKGWNAIELDTGQFNVNDSASKILQKINMI